MTATDNTKEVLEKALRRIGKEEEARRLFFLWPNLRDASLQLAGHIGAIVPGKGEEPLLDECLRQAFDAIDHNIDLDDRGQLLLYTRGLLEPIPQIIEVQITVQRYKDREVWVPVKEPIEDWMVRNKRWLPHKVVRAPCCSLEPTDVRTMIAARILGMSDISAMGGSVAQVVSG